MTLRYREDLEPSLFNLTFKIKSEAKVGIVGRTGAGKSSILLALFRLIELNEPGNSGKILIDGTDVSSLPLHSLRRNLAIIPQSPFLFQGSIAANLDPFGTHEVAALWKALDDVQLG